MQNILELLGDLPRGKTYGQDSPFVRTARIKLEHMEMLEATLTDEEKELLETYLMLTRKSKGSYSLTGFDMRFTSAHS